jgi:geranylgeranyl diphosphate synthase, type II
MTASVSLDPALASSPAPEALVGRLTHLVEQGLRDLDLPAEPASLYDPVRYVLDGGGKRVRPVLLLLAAETFGADARRVLPAALAVEVFHNFTLVHDDIMDHAAERRGRPTVHEKWDESTAILSGDLLMAIAYDLLAKAEPERLATVIRKFHRMVLRLCEGQALDKVFESRSDVLVAEYLDMIDRKTGALLEASLEIGGLIGRAPEEHLAELRNAGHELGRAFQIQDDLLDLVASDAGWGKTIGGDLIEGKKTFLLLKALEAASGDDLAFFQAIVRDGGLPAASVPEARIRMERLGVLDDARQTFELHYSSGCDALAKLPRNEASRALEWIAAELARRVR